MRLLVLRTSAMGDVALLTPVIRGFRAQYPDIEMTLVTRPAYTPFFSSIPGLDLFHPDFKKKHKGIAGILRLYKDLSALHKIDYVVDLHDVLRTWMLRFLFRLRGIRVKVIDKGRAEKKGMTSGRNKTRLKHSVERYMDVFASAGFPFKAENGPWITPSAESQKRISGMMTETDLLHIGVAPYAKHELKTWPDENMISLLKMIAGQKKVRFWLFGGKEDTEHLIAFQNKVPESVLIAGILSLGEEVALMSRLNIMIAMDSSNMHMAALAGTKTISIWGGTDPLMGFGAWQQPDDYSISIPVGELNCRPCTVYGKGKCRRGDFACMRWLTPERVFEKLRGLKVI